MKQQKIFSVDEYKKFRKNKKTEKESSLQVRVCAFIKQNYPNVIFQCDLASGMNLGPRIGGMNTRLRSSRGLPDLFIAHAQISKSSKMALYSGLFIELKREGIKLKNGEFPRDKHIMEQEEILGKLFDQGFQAVMVSGYDEAIKVITDYLS